MIQHEADFAYIAGVAHVSLVAVGAHIVYLVLIGVEAVPVAVKASNPALVAEHHSNWVNAQLALISIKFVFATKRHELVIKIDGVFNGFSTLATCKLILARASRMANRAQRSNIMEIPLLINAANKIVDIHLFKLLCCFELQITVLQLAILKASVVKPNIRALATAILDRYHARTYISTTENRISNTVIIVETILPIPPIPALLSYSVALSIH